jgi:hypothetical protein
MLIFILCGALSYYLVRYAWLLMPSSCVAIRLEQAAISLFSRDGSELVGVVSGTTLVTSTLIVLNVTVHGNVRSNNIVIFPDSVEREQLRALRVRLRWDR